MSGEHREYFLMSVSRPPRELHRFSIRRDAGITGTNDPLNALTRANLYGLLSLWLRMKRNRPPSMLLWRSPSKSSFATPTRFWTYPKRFWTAFIWSRFHFSQAVSEVKSAFELTT